VQRGQSVPPGRLRHVAPENSGAHACNALLGVDSQLGHGGGAHQHRVGQPAAQRRGAVPGALRRDREADGGCGADDLGDLLGERGIRDGSGVVGHPEVPGRPRQVVRRVAGKVHRAAAEPSQGLGPEDLLHCHEDLLPWTYCIVAGTT
jgi:hypothetical protein